MVLDRLRSIRHLLSGAGVFLKHRPDSVYTVADRLEEHADDHPDRPFVLYEDQVLSWADMDAAANRVAHWAEAQRLKQGDVVALLCVDQSMSGGVSEIASAITIHDTMLARRPDLVEALYGDIPRSRLMMGGIFSMTTSISSSLV